MCQRSKLVSRVLFEKSIGKTIARGAIKSKYDIMKNQCLLLP